METRAVPFWWPQIVAAADRRRHVTGLLLAHATPRLVRGRLQLTFTSPRLAAAWRESGAQDALEGALRQHRITAVVEVVAA
jgi:hypothetical protein